MLLAVTGRLFARLGVDAACCRSGAQWRGTTLGPVPGAAGTTLRDALTGRVVASADTPLELESVFAVLPFALLHGRAGPTV